MLERLCGSAQVRAVPDGWGRHLLTNGAVIFYLEWEHGTLKPSPHVLGKAMTRAYPPSGTKRNDDAVSSLAFRTAPPAEPA